MSMPNWLFKKINEVTLEDAIQAHTEGVDFICGDGKLKKVSRSSTVKILDVLKERGV